MYNGGFYLRKFIFNLYFVTISQIGKFLSARLRKIHQKMTVLGIYQNRIIFCSSQFVDSTLHRCKGVGFRELK